MKRNLLSLCLLFLSCTLLQAQQEPSTWLGVLDVEVAELRLEVKIDFDDEGNPTAKMFSLDQGNAEIPVESLVIDGNSVKMKMPAAMAKFEGTLNDEADECKGTFTQAGKEFPLVFKKVDSLPEADHTESWKGSMEAGGRTFDFQLRFFADQDGNKSLKLDSLSESLTGLKTDLTLEENNIEFHVPLGGATYKGTYNEAGDKITGNWIQGGGEFELNFEKIEINKTEKAKSAADRPQTPKAPFPYDTEDLTFENKQAGCSLEGTLTTPKGDGPFPTVILISGSGPQDRDETLVGHKPFLVLADHLTRNGIAVFRYDERGVGNSTGDFNQATSADLANDVEAIFKQLRDHAKVDGDQLGLIGHSEGGLIAPMVASRNRDVAFIVLMAGPGVSGREIVLKQSFDIAKVAGAPEEALELNRKVMSSVLAQLSPSNPDADLAAIARATMEAEEIEGLDDAMKTMEAGLAPLDTVWFRFFNVYEPAPALEKTRCPVLSVIGEKDLQVDCEMNQTAIEAALKKGRNKDFTISRLPDLNHLFQKCKTGSPTEYGQIDETLNIAFLDLVTDWIKQRTK